MANDHKVMWGLGFKMACAWSQILAVASITHVCCPRTHNGVK